MLSWELGRPLRKLNEMFWKVEQNIYKILHLLDYAVMRFSCDTNQGSQR